MHELMERCEGKWHDLLRMCGGLDSRYLNGKHGPCPMCGGKDRFRFTNWQNRGGWICNQCGSGDGAALIMRLKNLSFGDLVSELEKFVGDATTKIATVKTQSQAQVQAMQRIWAAAKPVEAGDPVDLYLRSRGLEFGKCPPSIRFHPECHHSRGKVKLPAMVARVDGANGELSQLHQTYLSGHGGKADIKPARLFHYGSFEDGSAVRLGRPNGTIGAAEGIETALAASQEFGFAVWATLSAQLMLKWAPPKGVKALVIFGDNDENFTGQSKAFALANRLAIQRPELKISVRLPTMPGTDWNDQLSRSET